MGAEKYLFIWLYQQNGYVSKRSTEIDLRSVLTGVRRFESCRTHLLLRQYPNGKELPLKGSAQSRLQVQILSAAFNYFHTPM